MRKRTAAPAEAGPTDVVTINLVDPTTFPIPDFDVIGTARPTNATVRGILTNTTTGITIASNPASVLCTGANGNWTLHFQGVPPGSYILGVNEEAPDEGADAKNVIVTSAVTLTLNTPIPTTPTTATVTGTNTGTTPVTVSAVLSMSPPKHGKPKQKKISAGANFQFDFDGLPHNKDFTVTVYPIQGSANGAVGKGKTKP
jgi:hypothetical protein